MYLSILLILLVFIGSASAADFNGTDILSVDKSTDTNEKLALDTSSDTSDKSNDTNVLRNNGNNLLSTDNSENGNILKSGECNFTNLEEEIRNAPIGGEVTLNKDIYRHADTETEIIISEMITINGNGEIIDLAGSSRVFTVTASNVVIKNLIIRKVYLSAGKKITMKLNGKTYTAKTNDKGQATFSLSITKKGKFSSTIKFAGDKTYASASKSVKITIK